MIIISFICNPVSSTIIRISYKSLMRILLLILLIVVYSISRKKYIYSLSSIISPSLIVPILMSFIHNKFQIDDILKYLRSNTLTFSALYYWMSYFILLKLVIHFMQFLSWSTTIINLFSWIRYNNNLMLVISFLIEWKIILFLS